MSLILKQETASSIPAPPSGKTTLFVDTNGTLNTVASNGAVQNFPTAGGSNTQVYFNDNGSFGASSNLTFNKTSSTLTVANLSVTGTLAAGDITVSSIANGTSNVDIVGVGGNVTTSVGGNANIFVVTGTGANVNGTLSASGNIIANSKLLVGTNTTSLVNPVAVFTGAGVTYSQLSMQNPTGSGSADITVYGNNGDDTQSWTDMGFTGNTFSDANYTVTAPGDGYLFVQGNSSFGGNLVLATGATGTVKDIVFATGGFLTGNIKARLYNANGTFSASGNLTGANINASGLITATGNLTAGNIITAGLASITGNVTAGNLVTAGSLGVTGNGNVGNLLTTGLISAGGNLSAGNISTFGIVSASGNGTFGNVIATAHIGNLSGSGNSNVGNLGATGVYATTLSATGNANVGNIGLTGVYATTLSATGNANVGNIGAAAGVFTTVTGSLTTAAQPNITSLGTLTSISVSGNANVGNVNISGAGTASSYSATGNITAGNLVTAGIVSATGGATFAGNVAMSSKNITGLADPVGAQDAATKNYVDTTAQGLHVHAAANAATTGTLATASSGTVTYNNGSSGVGATLTTTGSYTTIDGVNIASVGTRILVKNEANAAWNGVYTYSSSTVLTRATDFDQPSEVAGGDFLFVTSGTTQADTGWVQTTDAPVTIGTSFIVFAQFSGAGTYQAGTGLTLTGTTFSVNASQTQVTAVGTLTTLSVSGNANVGNIGATNIVGTLTTAAQTNITSVGTLGLLSVTGNVTAANVTATHYGAATGLTGIPGANVTGTLSVPTTSYAATVSGAAQANITSVGTLTALTVSGNLNVSSGSFMVGNVVATSVAGSLTTAAQPNITSVGTLTSLSSSGNITGANIISTTNHLFSVATGISAAGSTQGTATAISKDFNVVSTVASGAGVVFPAAVAGMRFTVLNTSANALLVYPATSGVINSLATNAAYSQPAGARLDYIATSTTQWYTLNATYG